MNLKPAMPRVMPSAIASRPLEPVEWLVEPLIAHGDTCVIAGETRAMKSWVLLHMLLHIACGKTWLGHAVPKRRRVLYVDEDMNLRTLVRRIKRLADGAGIDLSQLDPWFIAINRQAMRFHGGAIYNLLANMAPYDPEVVACETLARVLVGDENEAASVGQFWNAVNPLVLGARRSFIITHHLSKANRQPGMPPKTEDERTRGSGAILAGCDAHLSLTRAWPEPRTILKAWKSREGEEASEFTVQLSNAGPHGACSQKVHECPVGIWRL